MKPSMLFQSQLLATKFFVPVAPGTLISRPRLTALLDREPEVSLSRSSLLLLASARPPYSLPGHNRCQQAISRLGLGLPRRGGQ